MPRTVHRTILDNDQPIILESYQGATSGTTLNNQIPFDFNYTILEIPLKP